MKLMIASDLHGSAYYGRKLLAKLAEEKADKLLLLGDLLYHGPRNEYPEEYDTKALFAMLNGVREKLICVRGNCDSEVDQMVLAFPIMAENAMLFFDGITMMATHGHKYHIDELPPLEKGNVLIYGHYHVTMCEERDGIICMNPGSVSLPKDGCAHAYMVYEDHVFTWKDFDGNVLFTYTWKENAGA